MHTPAEIGWHTRECIVDLSLTHVIHPMWRYYEDVKWSTVREMSFNFGWHDYHPHCEE